MKVPGRKHPVVVAFLVLISLFTLGASPGLAQEGASGANSITEIDVTDNTIVIKADGPFTYSLVRTADPFRAVLEMKGVGTGRFKGKIYPKNTGVTEISPSETASAGTRLEILLQSPSEITPEQKDNTLTLRMGSASDEGASREAALITSPVVAQGGAKAVTAVSFGKTEEGVELIIRGDGPMPDPALSEEEGGLVLDIPGVAMKTKLPSRLSAPVKGIRHLDLGDRTRIIVETAGTVESDAFALDDEIILDIAPLKKGPIKADRPASAKGSTKESPMAGSSKDSITLDFQDADIVPILRLLGEQGGYNIVIHPDVKGTITMKLVNVPWEQAMDIILRTFSLEKIIEGNVIRVTTLKAFQEEKKAVAETREVFGTAEDVESRVFILNYAEVDRIKESLASAKILSSRGNISVDARTRSIVVKDIPSILTEVEKLVTVLDKPTAQVSIESRIVEISSGMAKSLGVEWGFLAQGKNVSVKGSESGLPLTPVVPVPGGHADVPSLAFLPASTTATGFPTSAMTFGYLNAAKTFGLDLRLSAIADIGKGKIISNPKVVTTDNQKAKIIQGESIPYGEITPSTGIATVTTKFKDVALTIEVTPRISNDGTISMNVMTSKEELVGFVDIGQGVQAPRTTKIEGTTSVLIKDGETMVIGGIYRNATRDNTSGVPGLMDIPLLGWLFKKNTVEDDTREVLIFITPRLVKQ